MSEYCDKESSLEFIGSDGVYKGSKSGNFTSFVKKNPRCLILLDEVEKAHISIIHLFLQILDDGRLTRKEQEILRAVGRNTMISLYCDTIKQFINKEITYVISFNFIFIFK